MLARFFPFVAAMALVVSLSNYLVQFPVQVQLGGLQLADLLTWGAFTYPLAFFITDLTNRRFGVGGARAVAIIGFIIAVVLSIWLASPRIAVASGAAFLMAQLLDISIFDALRSTKWWRAPLISSVVGSVLDTGLFFCLAFAFEFNFLGHADSFASATSPLLGVFDITAPRWVSWAIGDLWVKVLVALVMLLPYWLMRHMVADRVIHPAAK